MQRKTLVIIKSRDDPGRIDTRRFGVNAPGRVEGRDGSASSSHKTVPHRVGIGIESYDIPHRIDAFRRSVGTSGRVEGRDGSLPIPHKTMGGKILRTIPSRDIPPRINARRLNIFHAFRRVEGGEGSLRTPHKTMALKVGIEIEPRDGPGGIDAPVAAGWSDGPNHGVNASREVEERKGSLCVPHEAVGGTIAIEIESRNVPTLIDTSGGGREASRDINGRKGSLRVSNEAVDLAATSPDTATDDVVSRDGPALIDAVRNW